MDNATTNGGGRAALRRRVLSCYATQKQPDGPRAPMALDVVGALVMLIALMRSLSRPRL
jgi:hypothetical protein